MVRVTFLAVVTICTAVLMLLSFGLAEGHHTGVPCGPANNPGRSVCLPYADSSFAVRTLQQTGRLTYCFNQRAANYPNFIQQVREVNADQEAMWGFDWVEVAGVYQSASAANAAGCHVWHSMPETHGCSNCGAWVHYLNKPVIVEYRWQTGYVSWHTTIAHEITHILGLHEHYDDANFLSHLNSRGVWAHGYEYGTDPGTRTDSPTVMDFGTGQWRATEYDRRYVCENIDPNGQYFTGCGYVESVTCKGDPCWDGKYWQFASGWKYLPSDGSWWNPKMIKEWSACTDYGGRWNFVLERWFVDYHGYDWDYGWGRMPVC